ncbi:cilia- and flagella-associated protein 206-like [Ctenocephalides felis]|uniref:cilia- and flagella-associated protein 206-like n=1 Tax=Ctenocephalides felis TaxID=7515 RepID=UPI000E6E4EB7|nr:cilia- and flagella-associated protein 206-like [Ctenocephalides felis]
MERAFENDNVFKNVVQEICRECIARNLEVEESLVQQVTKLFALDIDMGISSEGVVKRDTLELFVNHVVSKLAIPDDESPQMSTLKMQLNCKEFCNTISESIKMHNESLSNYLYPLTREIINETLNVTNNNKESLEQFRRKLAVHILLESQMGHPSRMDVFNEGLTALSSIASLADIASFLESDETQKIRYIHELTHLVSGIRLLNKEFGRSSGSGILDVPSELDSAFAKSKTLLNNSLGELQDILDSHTTAILYSTEIDDRRLLVNFRVQPNLSLTDIENTRDRLILQRQYEIFLKRLKLRLEQVVSNLMVAKVPIMHAMLGDKPIYTRNEWLQKMPKENIDLTDFKCILLNYDEVSQKEDFYLKFNGFCIWYLVHCRGVLIPANPELGVLEHRSEYYAFSTRQAIEAFGRTPDRYLYSALEVIRGKPELVGLFEIQELILNMSDHALRLCQELAPKPDHKELRDVEIQTVTHLYETRIVKKYKWNVWDMRREAIQLANLSRGKSKSMQTLRTYSKVGVALQTTFLKNTSMQTTRENYTNTPTPLNYKSGLRAKRDQLNLMVDCTRPVHEDYYTCTKYNTILFDTPFPEDKEPECTNDDGNKFCLKVCHGKNNRLTNRRKSTN